MKLLLCISLLLNLIIIGCEIWTLSKIKKKINIIKYYTFFQNFLALIISVIFSSHLIIVLLLDGTIPSFLRGIRYIATCGLIATMFIYFVYLSSKRRNLLNKKDFISNFNPKTANFVFHYFCPIISLLSFVLFERTIVLTEPEWTGYAAFPSCIYWIIYIIFSSFNLWEEPYDFTVLKGKKKNILLEVLVMISIPLLYILISYVLWNVK